MRTSPHASSAQAQAATRALALALGAFFAFAAPLAAQDPAAAPDPPAAPAPASAPAPLPELPAEAESLIAMPTSELKIRVTPDTGDELQARADAMLEALRRVAGALAEAIIEQQRLAGDAEAKERFERVSARVASLRELRTEVIARTSIVLDALASKGGDVAAARGYVDVVAGLEPQLSEGLDEAEGEADDPDAADPEAELQGKVAAKIRFVRDQPPVHERPEPWTVPVKELTLELQPLRVEQLDERVQKWITILQREVRERIRIDIALGNSDDEAEQRALAERSAEQQRVVRAVVERIEAMLTMLNARGGETGPYRRYVANATGQRLSVTNPNILYAQVMAWLKSPDGGVKIALNLAKFLGVILVFWVVALILGGLIAASLKRSKRTSHLLRNFLVLGTRRTVLFIGVVVGVGMLGVNIGPLVAAIGAAGLVIGLALQGTLSNFATGLLILIYRPFDVGDVIDAAGVLGKVDTVTLVSTRLLSFDNQVMLVPNNQVWGGVITNLTKLDTRRVDLVFGIGYGDDIALAEQVIDDAVKAHPLVLENPEPTIRVSELGDNSVNFIVRPWAKTADYWDVYWDLTRQIKQKFDEAGLNIPYPQRDLHLDGPIEVVLGSGEGRPAPHPAALAAAPASVRPSNEADPGPGPADAGDEQA